MASILGWIGLIFFFIVLFAGLLSIALGIPGTWIIFVDAMVYAWITHFNVIAFPGLFLLLLLAIAGEVLEFFLSIKGVKRSKPSKGVVLTSFFSGLFLAILMAPLFFGFGAILGALIGTFGGAFLVEYLTQKRLGHAMQIGWKAFMGRLLGFLSKFTIASTMIVYILLKVFSS
ncbi:MAG: hypothetical protein DSY91_02235 [Deltaproteobacteria bacterium]|nr:MAG: hypothetical protein DSY91_02235 [Deltaproteobacteria bacterium]